MVGATVGSSSPTRSTVTAAGLWCVGAVATAARRGGDRGRCGNPAGDPTARGSSRAAGALGRGAGRRRRLGDGRAADQADLRQRPARPPRPAGATTGHRRHRRDRRHGVLRPAAPCPVRGSSAHTPHHGHLAGPSTTAGTRRRARGGDDDRRDRAGHARLRPLVAHLAAPHRRGPGRRGGRGAHRRPDRLLVPARPLGTGAGRRARGRFPARGVRRAARPQPGPARRAHPGVAGPHLGGHERRRRQPARHRPRPLRRGRRLGVTGWTGVPGEGPAADARRPGCLRGGRHPAPGRGRRGARAARR